jgi:two-component system, NarL family, sensor histidine kinase UhpB
MDTQEQDLHLQGPDESEEYRELFENATDAVLTLTADGILISWNAAFEKFTGWERREWVGNRLESLIHPADVPRFRELLRQIDQGEKPGLLELRMRARKGSELLLECSAFGIRRKGRPARVIMFSRDISTRKSNEEGLIESDAKLRSILESANDAIVFIGSNLEILSWNRAAQQIFGHFENTPGRPFDSLLAESQRGTYHATTEQLRAGGESLLLGKTLELVGLRADGTEFPLELSLAVWMFRGNPIFAAIIRDITKRKSAEEALQKKTGLVQLIQEIAIASNAAANPEEAMRYALDRICAHTNWPIGHVIIVEEGKPVSTDFWYTREKDSYEPLKRAAVAHPEFSKTSLIGSVIKQKKSIWIQDLPAEKTFARAEAAAACGLKVLFAFPVLKGSEVVAILEFFSAIPEKSDRDIIEVLELAGTQLGRVFERAEALKQLSEAEGRFRQLVESINAIVWRRAAKSGEFSFVSHQAEKTLGYPLTEWTQNPNFWEEHIHPDDRAWVLSFAQKEVEDKRNHEFDYRMVAADGRAIWMRNIVRVVVENDEPRELIGVMIDLTERKKAEDEIRQSRERLRALSAHLQFVREQERIKIAREVHDDLGQVLSALRMELSLLNQNLLESSDTAPRQQILQELSTMSKLVDDTIRSVRRIITELRPEVLDHLDLSSALEWQIQEFRARTGIKTTFQSTVQNSPLNQEGVTAIFRILQETITNVSRHAQASAVQVKLIDNDDSIILEVKDNGRGITEEETKKTGSFGILGMRERVLLLGGTLTMTGVPGKGTTVRVEIPLSENR